MGRAKMIAVAALLVAVPVVAVASGAADWLSGDSASAALFADDVRLAPPSKVTDATEEGAADLGVVAGPIDCPPAGAGPEDSEFLFQRQGERFWVTGTLSRFDGATAVVAGPTGDISATLAPEFQLVGDLSPGSAVQMTGTAADDGSMTAAEVRSVCPGSGVIDCARGEDPSFELRIQGDTFEVTGRLENLTNDSISVVGPGLVVQIGRDAGTSIEGGLDAGDPVRVEGTVGDAQQLLALAVALRCEEALLLTTATPAPSPEAEEAQQANETDGETCGSGAEGRGPARFEVDEDGDAKIRHGLVTANDGTTLTVETPAGSVTVVLDEDTETKGDVESAQAVTVEGSLQGDNSILAEEVKALCPEGEGQDQDDEGDEGTEDEDSGEGEDGESRGRGRGEGNGNGGRRGNGDDEGDEDSD